MDNVCVRVESLWKRFHRGEYADSLRDLVPAALGRWWRSARPTRQENRDFWALADVSFHLRRGEALGVIGPNGAGKSTLLKVLSRILRPNRGRVSVTGRLAALIEVSAGMHPDLTGRENIFLNGAILGMRGREIRRRLDAIVAFAGLEAFIDTPLKRYSSGMQARLGFAVAAHLDPDVLLVDEVLSVGDAAFRTRCIRHIESLIRSDVSVIFISHHLEQVRRLCDRCLVLEGGRVRFEGDVAQACAEYIACLATQPAQGSTGAPCGAGRLLSLTVMSKREGAPFEVDQGGPAAFRLAYEMAVPMNAVAVAVGIFDAAGTFVANVNTVEDAVPLPGTQGRHEVEVTIDHLPLAGGQYFMTARLMDADRQTTIDVHEKHYPLLVRGQTPPTGSIYLSRRWRAAA
jgi:lipopolysaccharide transport system ATP-binding protein